MTTDLRAHLDRLDTALAAATPGPWFAGPVELPPTFPTDLFWSRVSKSDSCWLWTGRTSNGYGRFEHRRQAFAAHRIAWLLVRGSIDPTLTIDHLCRVPGCVNPDHLEQVSMRENVMRSANPTAVNAVKTHCVNDHELAGDNLRIDNGRRLCRQCRRESNARNRRKPCPHCGVVMDRNWLPRHTERDHPLTAALTEGATQA